MVFVSGTVPSSPAQKCGIRAGDSLISVNGHEINDVLDYRFYTTEKKLRVVFLRDGKKRSAVIRKEEYADAGMEFCTYLMDEKKRCRNGCVFCFIDQNPPGMRESIYFKDDDERLSFLQGNYITLTNLRPEDVDRIIKMHISPVNVSVHTTEPELRVKMMRNRFAGECLKYLPELAKAGISINAQLVLVRGMNDGEHLRRSLTDLLALDTLESCACVPCGLTDHRDGLEKLEPYDAESAAEVIDLIDSFGDASLRSTGSRKAFASDEFYLLAGRDIPDERFYEGYPQLDNGVGMLRCHREEYLAELDCSEFCRGGRTAIVTGKAAEAHIRELIAETARRFPGLDCEVFAIENRFYGKNITVSGLLTGRDVIEQLRGKAEGRYLLLPCNMLRYERDMFLDGLTPADLERELGVKTVIIERDGKDLCQKVLSL